MKTHLAYARLAFWVAIPMARTSHMEGRLKMILDKTCNRRTLPRRVMLVGLGVAVAALVPLAMLRPLAQADVPASGTAADLANGVTVELVGVGSSPLGDGEDWWSADGKPLPAAPEQDNIRFHEVRLGVGTQYLRRALFFRLRARQDADISTAGSIVDPSGHLQTAGYHFGRDMRLNDIALKAGQAASGVALFGFPASEQAMTYRFGVASGPWQTLAVTKNTLHPAPGTVKPPQDHNFYGPSAWTTSKPGVEYVDTQGISHLLSLRGNNLPLEDVARRLQAADSAGQIIPLQEGSIGYDGEGLFQISAADLNRIAEFRLQTRPYQWTEFKNVVLRPQPKIGTATATPIPTPPALPGFQKTFASGITVVVNALTQRRADGGAWWRPDGALLPGPIKDRDASFGGWPPDEHPRALLFTLTAPRDMDYSEATQFLVAGAPPDPVLQMDLALHLQKGQPSESSRNQNFPADASACTLRYGVAAGSWTTIAAQKVHFTPALLLHRTVPLDHDFEGDVMLELSRQPRLIYKDAAGVQRELPFLAHPLGEVARQLVAVDAKGKLIPLNVSGSTGSGSIISLALSERSVLHNYNPQIDLSQIRELRLQTRPYEWTEFKNIALQPAHPLQSGTKG